MHTEILATDPSKKEEPVVGHRSDDIGLDVMTGTAGQGTCIDTLVAVHDQDVRDALRRVLGRSPDEDDLVQEAFVRLVVRIRQPGAVSVGPWLRGVAHNLAVDEIRRRRPIPVEDARLDREVDGQAHEAAVSSELYTCLLDAAQSLPDRQRAALAAALTNDSGLAAVATTLGVSDHAAESLVRRARFGLLNRLAMVSADRA